VGICVTVAEDDVSDVCEGWRNKSVQSVTAVSGSAWSHDARRLQLSTANQATWYVCRLVSLTFI